MFDAEGPSRHSRSSGDPFWITLGIHRLNSIKSALFVIIFVAWAIFLFFQIRISSNPSITSSIDTSCPNVCSKDVHVTVNNQISCPDTAFKTVYWKDRDPFGSPYESRPLDEVLIEMGEYGDKKEWERRSYLAKFASSIVERDKANPQVLRPPLVNLTLASLIPHQQPYWTYWNNGFDKAKPIVRYLHDITKAQLAKHAKENKWTNFLPIYLDDSKLAEYVSWPQHLIAKRSNYTTTYLSDLLRVELLVNYGGSWADSTFYWQKPMPKPVYDSDYFGFKIWHNPYYTSSWFLHARKPHNPLLLWVRHFMHEYWKTHEKYFYFDLHLFIEVAIQLLPEVRPYYDTMPFWGSTRAHAYHYIMTGEFNATKHEEAGTKSWGYKLSYKAKCNFVDRLEKEAEEARKYLADNPL
jgi:hypothetical protein